MQSETIISWEILEHEPRPKSMDWTWIIAILGGAITIASFIFGNYIFGIFLIIATFAIILYGHKDPDLLVVDVTKKGIRVNNEFFPYPTIDSFWMDDERGYPVLTILSKKRTILSHVRIRMPEEISMDDLREALLNHIDEDYHPPTFTESLIHFFQF